jgi:hypothetical protein
MYNDKPFEYLKLVNRDILGIIHRNSILAYMTDDCIQYVYNNSSPDIHKRCSGILHVYYMKFNAQGGSQVVESRWDTKEDLFASIRRSGSIPFITSWPIFGNNCMYWDGMGFPGTLQPRPDRIYLVGLSNIPYILLNNLIYVPKSQYTKAPNPLLNLQVGRVHLSNGKIVKGEYKHQYSRSIRFFLYVFGLLYRQTRSCIILLILLFLFRKFFLKKEFFSFSFPLSCLTGVPDKRQCL